ncbi:MAG: helix-turn-helix transcriptional regulator [Oscillospiraceae bacterium]
MMRNIEAERGRMQLSKEAVSKELGITSRTYNGYIQELRPIPSDKIRKMIKIFGCSSDYLLGLTDMRTH